MFLEALSIKLVCSPLLPWRIVRLRFPSFIFSQICSACVQILSHILTSAVNTETPSVLRSPLPFRSAFSYVRQGGLTWRRHDRTFGTGTADGQYVFGSGVLIHRSEQTSTRTLPSHNGMAFRLCVFAGGPLNVSSWYRSFHSLHTHKCE